MASVVIDIAVKKHDDFSASEKQHHSMSDLSPEKKQRDTER